MSISHLFKMNGPLISTAHLSRAECQDAEVCFHHTEKAECALTVGSSWYGGDYFEFGAHDLCTFRNMLTAYHISGMCQAYKDVRFYAFDIFGKLPVPPEGDCVMSKCDLKTYFKPYSDQGDQIELHKNYIKWHGLYQDKCHLVQGLFADTCTPEFKAAYAPRKIGFACIDCNVAYSYKTVFEFIFDMMQENSYIYMDEGLQNPDVLAQWEQFQRALYMKRNMKAAYIRNAGGFGSLWRLYPIINNSPLEL
jgi:hypothetical protein